MLSHGTALNDATHLEITCPNVSEEEIVEAVALHYLPASKWVVRDLEFDFFFLFLFLMSIKQIMQLSKHSTGKPVC